MTTGVTRDTTMTGGAHPPARGRLFWAGLAAAAAAAGAAFLLASARVAPLAAFFAALGDESRGFVWFFHSPWDMAGDPGLWLRLALGVVLPAVVVAAAFACLAPRVALRAAGVFASRTFVYVIIAAGVALVAVVAAGVLRDRALDFDESTFLFQSKIFAGGRLAAPAPLTEGDVDRAFFRAKTEVVLKGRWFAQYPPLHAALLAAGARLGWVKLAPVVASAFVLLLVYGAARRRFGLLGGAFAAALAASSPFFIFVQASYLSEASFLAFLALAAWGSVALTLHSRWPAVALGAGLGGVLLTRDAGALYVALPLLWLAWRRGRAEGGRGGGGRTWVWLAAALAPFVLAWALYNWRQTGNLFLSPRYFSTIQHFGFDAQYTPASALSSWARNLFVLSTDAFGWPMVCLVPAALRLFARPRLDDFEKALYALVVLNFLTQFPIRNAGISYGARYYSAAWLALTFITARFFVILAAWGQRRLAGAGEGWAAALLALLVGLNFAAYFPRAAARYGDRPWGNYSLWADAEVRRAVAALGLERAVVIIRPRDWCLSSIPGSPFLDDPVIYARDAGVYNAELPRLFPDRAVYLVDYEHFRRTGEIFTVAGGTTVNPTR